MNARSYILLSLTLLTICSQGMAQPVLDQSQLIYNGGTSARTLPGYRIGQSFTAGITGKLTEIDIGFFEGFAGVGVHGIGTLDIYSGEGASGTLLQTQKVNVDCAKSCLVPFATSAQVTAGQIYTFLFTPGTGITDPYGIQIGASAPAGPYSGGRWTLIDPSGTYFEDKFDLVFQTFVLAPCDSNSKEKVQFVLSSSAFVYGARTYFSVSVGSDKTISGKGLDSISFDLSYYGDLLESNIQYGNGKITTDIPAATINSSLTGGGKIETISFTIKGKDISLDPSNAIARIVFESMVADTTSTDITMSNLTLNGGDAAYKNCILSADPSSTNVTVQFLCGDSNLYKFIRTGRVLDIAFIRPNPAKDDISLNLLSAQAQVIRIEIMNELGASVFSNTRNIYTGDNMIHLDTHRLPSGMYHIRVSGAGEEVHGSLVISR